MRAQSGESDRLSSKAYLTRISYALTLAVLVSGAAGNAQTFCSQKQTGLGVTICSPSPGSGKPISAIFHLSAQANAPEGQTVSQFSVALDNRRIYEERLATPREQLSIEVNLRSPLLSGPHTLQLVVPGAGQAVAKDISFVSPDFVNHCNPDIGGSTRTCVLMRLGEPLKWSTAGAADFPTLLSLFDRNLRTLEAEGADAVAVDHKGYLYVASHAFADIDLRKYDSNGSMIYDSVVRACGSGFTEVTALSVDEGGHAWIAANTNACFQATDVAAQMNPATGQLRGLVLELDTSKASSLSPLYLAWFGKTPAQIRAMCVDAQGFVYAAGTTQSPAEGFIAKLSADGSKLLWSMPLTGALPSALALSGANTVLCAATRAGTTDDAFFSIPADGGKPTLLPESGGHGHVVALSAAGKRPFAVARDSTGRLLLLAGNSRCPINAPSKSAPATEPVAVAVGPALEAFTGSSGTVSCP